MKRKRCLECDKSASFNYENETKALYCFKHKLLNMIDVVHTKCLVCKKKRPSYNYKNEKPRYCKDCKKPDMIDVGNRKCIVCKKKSPSCNYKNEKVALYCAKCKLPDMIDIRTKKCIVCKKKQPTFNYENEINALYCSDCKKIDMIDVKNIKCYVCHKKQPTFNYENEKPQYCIDCKKQDMINTRDNKCIICKKIQPVFNYQNEKIALYCGKCKLPEMIDIKNKKCIVCRKIQPTFNYELETNASHCFVCKLPDMVDIHNPKCLTCKKRAWYGIPSNRPSRCAVHKQEGMISYPTARCIDENCSELAEYGIFKPIHCFTHKQSEDINLVERLCVRCNRLDVVNNDGICVNFCMKDDEYNIYKKRLKRKEKRVYDIVQEKCGVFDYCNQTIVSRCYKDDLDKPDCGYDCHTHDLYIECDENQHKDRCPKIEFERMINIYHQLEGKPVIFIRYNPDKFNFLTNSKTKSVKISQKKREEILINWVNYFLAKPKSFSEGKEYFKTVEPYNGVYILYLFYDNEIESYTKEMEIDPYDKNDFPELCCKDKDCCRCVN